MKRVFTIFAIVLGVLLLVVLVGPFLVPVPPLAGLEEPEALAGEDSRFLTIPFDGTDGITLHYREGGAGEPTFILLHGFGSNLYTWDEVFDDFAARGTTLAYDRPPFGLSQRLVAGDWSGENPYAPDSAVAQLISVMDAKGLDDAILVGNSAGGTLALRAALAHPERIDGLILVSPAVYTGGGAPAFVRPLLGLPQFDRLGPLIARQFGALGDSLAGQSFYDPSRITPEQAEKASLPLRVRDWDRGLWEFTKASEASDLVDRLADGTMPVLVVTGDSDAIVPTEESIRLASELPNAQLLVTEQCGHVSQVECPEPFLAAVDAWLATLPAE
jgi:pimeloyl-ACP methyl ester carboxylesterase